MQRQRLCYEVIFMGKTRNEIKLLKKLEKLKGKYYCDHSGIYDGRRVTTVWLEIENKFYVGRAECSHKDGFDRKLGRSIAMGRAMRCYGVSETTEEPEFLRARKNAPTKNS